MRTFRMLVCVAGLVIAPAAIAAEISHTAYTWLCPNEGRAHGYCTSRHSDCSWDCDSLERVCSVDRDGRLMRREEKTITDVGRSGTFRSSVDVALYGTGKVDYCTRNESKYLNWAGVRLLGQGTSTYCQEYSSSAYGGGANP